MQKFHELTYTGVSLPLLSRGASCAEWAHWKLGILELETAILGAAWVDPSAGGKVAVVFLPTT